VQFLDEFLNERIAFAAERPILRAGDVFLFGFVELAAVSDIGGNQLAPLLDGQGRRMLRSVEQVALRYSQNRRGLVSRMISSSRAFAFRELTPWPSSSMECSMYSRRFRSNARARSRTMLSSGLLGTSA
jgi:hypothetical protein